jgi:serine/threonine-protein kinase
VTARFPERIGRYEVLLPIASGGMGTVYLGRAKGIGGFERDVALKIMHAHLKNDAAVAAGLIEEAKLAVRIRHPNVVSVIDVDDDPFGIFMVMDYVEGDTLDGLQKRSEGPLPARFGLKLLLDALAGLHAAHELADENGKPLGLVHRDFSPHNILVGNDGVGRLTDFGVAKVATSGSATASGLIKGKIPFMSPEQARGDALDRRTDVWAAGLVAWQILAGRKLYSSEDNQLALLLKVASERPPRLREVSQGVPAAFDAVVARALEMEADRRWPTAQAFRQALLVACKECGEIADTEEVAAFVSRLVEPRLVERRTRVQEVVRARGLGSAVDHGPEPSDLPTTDVTLNSVVTSAPRDDTTTVQVPARRRRTVVAIAAATAVVLTFAVSIVWTVLRREPPPAATSHAEPTAAADADVELTVEIPTATLADSATPAPVSRPRGRPYRPSPARSAPSATPSAHSVLPPTPYH